MCLFAVEHLQDVFAFVVLCGVKDLNPDFLSIAARLRPGVLVNLFLPAGELV